MHYVVMSVIVLIMVLVSIILSIKKREDLQLNRFLKEILMHSKIKLIKKTFTPKVVIVRILIVRRDTANVMRGMSHALINANVNIARMIKLHLNQF